MEPLLLSACKQGIFGKIQSYEKGCIYISGFAYLEGEADAEVFKAFLQKQPFRMFIALTPSWEAFLANFEPTLIKTHRTLLSLTKADSDKWELLSQRQVEGVIFALFDEKAFLQKPFHHADNYPSYEAFRENGIGAVAWAEDKIVGAASSFLSVGKDVELDLFVEKTFRKKGIADILCARVLTQAMQRGITVHWDAQNAVSRHLAEKLGYEKIQKVIGYSLETPNEP